MKKKMTHKLSDQQKVEIVSLMLQGYSPTEVAKAFGVSRSTVYYYYKKHKEAKEDES